MRKKFRHFIERDRRFEFGVTIPLVWSLEHRMKNPIGDLHHALEIKPWIMSILVLFFSLVYLVLEHLEPDPSKLVWTVSVCVLFALLGLVTMLVQVIYIKRACQFVKWVEAIEATPYFQSLGKPIGHLDLPEYTQVFKEAALGFTSKKLLNRKKPDIIIDAEIIE